MKRTRTASTPAEPPARRSLRACRAAPRRAFTLLELMVSLGVIMVLLSFLIPAIGRTREAGIDLQRLNLARQNAIAIVEYTNRYRGCFPFRSFESAAVNSNWWAAVFKGDDDARSALAQLDAGNFSLSRCFTQDFQHMRPGHTLPWFEFASRPKPVFASDVSHPSLKGMVFEFWIDYGPATGPWCCTPEEIELPVIFADLSGERGRWWDFLPGNRLYVENGIGWPISLTWYGSRGRDR